VRSPATKQRARPHRCHRQVARGQVLVIVEHSDDDHCEDRRDDKQHHYADHTRCLHAESKQRGTSWARRLLRGGHSRGAPTKLVNTVADERGMPAGPDWVHEIKHDSYRLVRRRSGCRCHRGRDGGMGDGLHFTGVTSRAVPFFELIQPVAVRRHGHWSVYGPPRPSVTCNAMSSSRAAVSIGSHP
jgi:hypothetical protein